MAKRTKPDAGEDQLPRRQRLLEFLELCKQWHPTKNGALAPDQFAATSELRVWWICPAGQDHEWQSPISSRTRRGSGCPACAGLQASKTNSLASLHPEIAIEWHRSKNGALTPESVVAGSSKKAWWSCAVAPDHEWEARIFSRTRLGSGCAVCAGYRPSVTNSLQSRFPAIAAQWHPTKNGALTPAHVLAASKKKYWWRCSKELTHEWERAVRYQLKSQGGCPVCQLSVTGSLASLFPQLAAQWHPTRNDNRTPEHTSPGSHKEIWWRCIKNQDHEWLRAVKTRTSGGADCPFCVGKIASTTNSLAHIFPKIAAEWHSTKNGELLPEQIQPRSHKSVWWKCLDQGHEWEMRVETRTRYGRGCQACATSLSAMTPLASLSPKIAAEWHPMKNGESTPEMVMAASSASVWWKCQASPGHEWQARVTDRARNDAGCPFCLELRVSETDSLAFLFPKTSVDWHPTKNGRLTPQGIAANSATKVWWSCPNSPDHSWKMSPRARTNLESGCPTCGVGRNRKSLGARFPAVAAEWHPTKNGALTPDQVAGGSGTKAWWICPKSSDHEWEARISSRTGKNTGCAVCAGYCASVTNSLSSLFPDVAVIWHPTKNAELNPENTVSSSYKLVWWRCQVDPRHEWQRSVRSQIKSTSDCPACQGRRASLTNSLASRFPQISAQWHPTRNDQLTPENVLPGSHKVAWWRCLDNQEHEWTASVKTRTRGKADCPLCAGRRVSVTNSLAQQFPELAAEWHPTRNEHLTPDQTLPGSHKSVWWKCAKGLDHEWQAGVDNRVRLGTGCPRCNVGWTTPAIRAFVASLLPHIAALTPAERYTIFQQSGLLDTNKRSNGFIKALATGHFPHSEVEKFARGSPSLADSLLADDSLTIEELLGPARDPETVPDITEAQHDATEDELPVIQTCDALAVLDHHLVASADQEATAFLVASAREKLWRHAYQDEAAAVAQARAHDGGVYATEVRETFLREYDAATALPIPLGVDLTLRRISGGRGSSEPHDTAS